MSDPVSIPLNPLKNEPISRLVRQISTPVSIGMFFQTMYNVVDTWAAGRLSTEALAALTASFPVFFLIIAVAHGCQAAASALISHALGADDEETARELAGQSLFFATWMSLAVGAIGWGLSPQLFDWLGIVGETRELGIQYVRTIFWATPCFVIGGTFHAMLSARGNTRPFRNALIAGFFLNIIFDLWFVFGGWGLSPMGFAGIARATVLIQMGVLLYYWYMAVKAGFIPPSGFAHLHPRWRAQRRLMGQGFPALLNMLTIAAGIFIHTHFAGKVGTEVLAAFGTGMRIEQIALLPIIGLNTAAMTLAGHSYGAGRLDRLRETVFVCMRTGTVLYLIGAPIVAGFAPFWMSRFSQDPEVIAIGATFLRFAMATMYSFVILFISTSVLQGLQRPHFAIWLGLYRQFLAPLLLIPILMARFERPEIGIWWGVLISTWSGALIAALFLMWTWRSLKKEFAGKNEKIAENPELIGCKEA
ncbi:MAG: MATE family efflux transporter [Verrucomicrobia bacterium]|nr:MATE family efflux transporter [Verrucomicrobiota bacterium]MCH8510698.1 MATE family efflux transporter [Kiritimatiellia bacterium]